MAKETYWFGHVGGLFVDYKKCGVRVVDSSVGRNEYVVESVGTARQSWEMFASVVESCCAYSECTTE